MRNIQNSKYDLRLNPVYQIDWNQEASGKRVKATKRRVRFRFGFSHRESIEQGQSGMNCRGEEHEVILIWSLTSGKRLVVADGEEIHFSKGKVTDAMFETSWQIQGGHMIKIIAYAAPPLFPQPGFRQFDLQIDGLSFFNMPKIYELGSGGNRHGNYAAEDGAYDSAPQSHFALPASSGRRQEYNQRESSDRFAYSSNPEFSVPESSPPPRRAPLDRRNTMPELPATPVAPPQRQETSPAYYTPQQYTPSPSPAVASAPPAQPQALDFMQAPPPRDEFAPVAPPAPTFAETSQQILSAYTPVAPQALPQLANAPHFYEYGSASPGATMSDVSEHEDDSPPVTPEKPEILKPTMAPLTIVEMEEREMENMNEVDRAMKTLVNLGDITRCNETPEQAKTSRRREEDRRNDTTKSSPLPPTAAAWQVGANPALGDIQKHKPTKEAPKKEVMRTHAFDPNAAQAGMMVVYGATSSLPAPHQGFGAGVAMNQQAYYFNKPQPYPAMNGAAYAAPQPLYMAH